MDMSFFYQDMLQLAAMVLTALVAVGIAYLRKYVNENIKNEELKQSIALTLDTISSAAKAAISDLSDQAQKALADGKITPEEMRDLEAAARRQIEQNLTPAMKERLQAHVGDVDRYVQMKVKAAVNDLLINASASTGTTIKPE